MFKKIVIAPDSFKGTMSSCEICGIVERAVLKWYPHTEVVTIPVADGGEGMVEAYLKGAGGKVIQKNVTGPMFLPVESFYGILSGGKTAVIEMAAASGLTLVAGPPDPMHATSMGTGELIMDALERGCDTIILGLGGSATMDGGMGMATALGIRFLDKKGGDVPPTAAGLADVRSIDPSGIHPAARKARWLIASDVINPLTGKYGVAYGYGKQKGATPDEIKKTDGYLNSYCSLLNEYAGQKLQELPGTGAAGGLALPLLSFFGAKLTPGIDLILDVTGFDEKIRGAGMVITGEGKIDGQTACGKVPAGVALRAKAQGVPVVALAGDLGEGFEKVYDLGITAVFSTNKAAVPFEIAAQTCREDLALLADSLMRFWSIRCKDTV